MVAEALVCGLLSRRGCALGLCWLVFPGRVCCLSLTQQRVQPHLCRARSHLLEKLVGSWRGKDKRARPWPWRMECILPPHPSQLVWAALVPMPAYVQTLVCRHLGHRPNWSPAQATPAPPVPGSRAICLASCLGKQDGHKAFFFFFKL